MSTKRKTPRFSAGELESLVQAWGEFEVCARYADLSLDASFDHRAGADRLILVLRRKRARR